MNGIFKYIIKKEFWRIWLSLSLLGALITYYFDSIYQNKIENGLKCNAKIYDEFQFVFVLENSDYFMEEYIDFFENHDKYEFLPFPLKSIGYEEDVVVLDTLESGKIYKIAYKDQKKYWKNVYIYHKYVSNCGSSINEN